MEHSDPALTHDTAHQQIGQAQGNTQPAGKRPLGIPASAVNFFQQTVHVLFGWGRQRRHSVPVTYRRDVCKSLSTKSYANAVFRK